MKQISLILCLITTALQAQDVDLTTETGWVRTHETYDVVNGSTTVVKVVFYTHFTNGAKDDMIVIWSNNGVAVTLQWPHNFTIVNNPLVTLVDSDDLDDDGNMAETISVQGSRIAVNATTAPSDLSMINIKLGNTDGNFFYFNNSAFGSGGNPHNLPASWQSSLGYHTDEEQDDDYTTSNTSNHWLVGTTTASTPINITSTTGWDTNNDTFITVAEWKQGLASMGYTGISNVYATTQTQGDAFIPDPNDVQINTQPLLDTDFIPPYSYRYYVTLLDNNAQEISSGYGVWVTGNEMPIASGDVNLNDPGWVRIGETFENINSGAGIAYFAHYGHFTAGLMDDIIFVPTGTINGVSLTYPHSFPLNGLNYDLIGVPPNVIFTQPTEVNGVMVTQIDGRRVQLSSGNSPNVLSGIRFSFGGGIPDSNPYFFNNMDLGNGGNPFNIPTIWQGHLGYHTDEDIDDTNTTTSTGNHWQPNTVVATTPINISSTSGWDTNNDGNLTIAEWKIGLSNLGYSGIVNVYNTVQSQGDTFGNYTASGINTTPVSEVALVPTGNFQYYVTIQDANGFNISSGYGAWIVGSNTLSVNDYNASTNSFIIYPNPTSDQLFIKGEGLQSVKVFSIDGKSFDINLQGNKLNTSSLQSGIYILQIEDAQGKVSTQKFIKE